MRTNGEVTATILTDKLEVDMDIAERLFSLVDNEPFGARLDYCGEQSAPPGTYHGCLFTETGPGQFKFTYETFEPGEKK